MNRFFKVKVVYDRNGKDGNFTTVTETYLVGALSFTEARITKELKPFVSGDFIVKDIKGMRISEIFENNEGDKWYRCKVVFVSLDEEKGIEKRTASAILVQGADFNEALEVLLKGMEETLANFEIASITETPIMDYLKLNN